MNIREEAENFQKETGIELPEKLIALYESKGNGGFGPRYGLIGIINGHKTDLDDSMLTLYQSFCEEDPEDPGWHWPRNLVPFIHLGCSIHLCINIEDPLLQIIEFDPNDYGPGGNLSLHFKTVSPSFEDWLAKNKIQE